MFSPQRSLLFAALSAATLCNAQATPSPAELAELGVGFEVSQHASADLSWYEAPANFSDQLAPGSILKIEVATNLTNYTVPSSLSMSRIIYTTTNVNGTVLPASAYILWPYDPLPIDAGPGMAVALWSHGTSGLFKPCAPSNYRSLQYHFMIPYTLATQGMVVVAPDYQGLGVGSLPNGDTVPHPWATTPSNANDLAYALIAARAAFPEYLVAEGPFVTLGHSEGGRSAWGFAQRQVEQPVAGYKGTIAFSPVGDAIALIEQAEQHPNTVWSFNAKSLGPMTMHSITSVYPAYNWRGLTKASSKVFDLYKKVQGCLPTQTLLFFGILSIDQFSKPNWTKDPIVKQWQKLTAVGRKRFAGPLLVLAGEIDGIIPYNDTISSSLVSTVQDTCDLMKKEGWSESLELVGYPQMAHFPVIQASQSKWLAWVKDRLTGSTCPTGCGHSEMKGFRTEYTLEAGPSQNFLLEWVNSTYSWEYSM